MCTRFFVEKLSNLSATFATVVVLICTTGPLFAANVSSADVENIRISNQAQGSRVVFDLSHQAKFRVFSLKNPHRVVVDLYNTGLNTPLPSLAQNQLIQSLRSGVHGGVNLRVVFDVNQQVKTKSFTLPATAKTQHRFVLDLSAHQSNSTLEQSPSRQIPKAGQLRDVVVVIDAGHGGKDPGAIGPAGTYEKNVALQISRRLAAKINQQQGMKAVLTRDTDIFLPLRERLERARKAKADLFLSIHADAFLNPSANGASVYALSLNGATSEAAAWLAKSENAAHQMLGGVDLQNREDDVASVLLNLSQTATIQASLDVGEKILSGIGKYNRLHKGKVQQAGFVVLKSPDIPSVLIETAFLSNPKEEKKLNTKEYQVNLAHAITDGVKKYFIRKAPPGTYLAAKYGASANQISANTQ